MPKRRTREQKKRATGRRLTAPVASNSVSADEGSYKYSSSNPPPSSTSRTTELLSVPAHYITSDLRKTVLFSLIFLAIIFGLYWYLELGGRSVLPLPF